MPAKEIGAYWVEHVIRQKGTKHFQLSGKDMPFYKRHLLDVVLAMVVIVVSFVIVLFLLFRYFVTKYVFRPAASSVKIKTK